MTTALGRILIVDDEANARSALDEILGAEGYTTETAPDGEAALRRLGPFDPDVILTDLKMPKLDGIGLMTKGRLLAPHAAFVVMTAFGSIETAVEAIKQGAENYITKPIDVPALIALVGRAREKALLSKEAARLRSQITERYTFDNILGDHPSMQRLLKQVSQVAGSRATVLIHGESGTGKELIASALHHNSKRDSGAFVRLNCAALAETLLESELFGHERGAFTGATHRRDGRFQQANGGTLFLDEVSEIPASVQVKLLRFLQERAFERVGGNETISVDVRVVAATNRDLAAKVQDGSFREDLYYRLNVVELNVPPLRARKSDLPLLAHAFLKKFAKENERDLSGFTDAGLRKLMAYTWPGNVRELENAVERAVVMSEGTQVDTKDIVTPQATGVSEDIGMLIPGATMADLEKVAIEQTLDSVGGDTGKAADILSISRRKIQYRLKEWRA